MFHCPNCRKNVITPECSNCGYSQREADEIASGFLEFLRHGRYKRPEPKPPEPFRQRLATFVNCDESEVMLNKPWHSKMPLLILAPIGPYIGTKSKWFIRFILARIHRLVRHG